MTRNPAVNAAPMTMPTIAVVSRVMLFSLQPFAGLRCPKPACAADATPGGRSLVGCRAVDAFDGYHVEDADDRLQLQPELFLHGGQEIGTVRRAKLNAGW